jgi:hypothetical protein
MRPSLNIKYHHFREEVKKGTVSIYHVATGDKYDGLVSSDPENS